MIYLWFLSLPFRALWALITGPIHDPDELEKWAGYQPLMSSEAKRNAHRPGA